MSVSLGYAFGIFKCFVRLTLAVVIIIIVVIIGCITFEEVLLFGVGIISKGLGNSCQLLVW